MVLAPFEEGISTIFATFLLSLRSSTLTLIGAFRSLCHYRCIFRKARKQLEVVSIGFPLGIE